MRSLSCLRCGAQMNYLMTEKIQLGQTGWFMGSLSNLFAGAMELDIYSCPHCGKVEFFQSGHKSPESTIGQRKCPGCGKIHDFDYPKCPFCKFDYNE